MKLAVTLPLAKAASIVDTVLATARQESMLPITVVVLDSGGKLIAMKSEDGSGLLRFGYGNLQPTDPRPIVRTTRLSEFSRQRFQRSVDPRSWWRAH